MTKALGKNRLYFLITDVQADRLAQAAKLTQLTSTDLLRRLIDWHLQDVVTKALDNRIIQSSPVKSRSE